MPPVILTLFFTLTKTNTINLEQKVQGEMGVDYIDVGQSSECCYGYARGLSHQADTRSCHKEDQEFQIELLLLDMDMKVSVIYIEIVEY